MTPLVFTLRFGQLFFVVDEERVVIWYSGRGASDVARGRLRKGKQLPVRAA